MRKYDLTINDKPFSVNVIELSAEEAELEVNGKPYKVSIDRIAQTVSTAVAPAALRSVSSPAPVVSPAAAPSGDAGAVFAPIPGSIMEVYVKVGEKIQAGEPLYKMEAMKMENEINAQLDGTVSVIEVSAGDTVNQGQEVMRIAPDAAVKNRRQDDKNS